MTTIDQLANDANDGQGKENVLSKKITITVSGPVGIGKTTVCQMLQQGFEATGLSVVAMPPELSAETNFIEKRDTAALSRAMQELLDSRVVIEIKEECEIPRSLHFRHDD